MIGRCLSCKEIKDVDEEAICRDCRRKEHVKEEVFMDRIIKIKEERSGCKYGRCDL